MPVGKYNHKTGENAPNWKGGWKNNLPKCKECDKVLSKMGAIHCVKHKPHSIVKFGIDNHMWKGDNVKYISLHIWVASKLGKPSFCENCGSISAKRYEWANLTREYIRDLSKWTRLCSSCHIKHDRYNHELKLVYKNEARRR